MNWVKIGVIISFKYKDKIYKSLTAIAMEISGYKVSGIRFFNLDK